MLKNETDKVTTPDYKKLAKEYYLALNPATVNTNVEVVPQKKVEGQYTSGSSDMETETVTKIETATKIEAGKNYTEASITMSAGADQRKMNLVEAKVDRQAKMDELKALKAKFTNTDNQAVIETLIQDLSTTNIESKIVDKKTGSMTNTEQHGNRYLIAARLAEGFVNVLSKLTMTPEPKLTKLAVDWTSCEIGAVNADVPTDRDITISIDVKMETTTTQQILNVPVAASNASTSGTSSTTTTTTTGTGSTGTASTGTTSTSTTTSTGTGSISTTPANTGVNITLNT
jgi:hypothetical protein